jgi:integrase
MTGRRDYGSGGISWLGPRKVRLLVRVKTDRGERSRVTKVVTVAHDKSHGGVGQAKVELKKFQEEIARQKTQPPAKATTTFGEMLHAYVADCKRRGRTQSTIESFTYSIKRIPHALGALPLTELTAEDLDAFYGEMGERLADNTIRQTHAIITAALELAVRWKRIAANPARDATPPDRERTERVALPLTDVARMIAAAEAPLKDGSEGDPVLAMAIAAAALTGARRGELCGLRWDDLHTDNCTITVKRQWVPTTGGGGQYLSLLKNSRKKTDQEQARTVVLGPQGLALFERFRDIQRELLRREPEGWLLSYDAGSTPMKAKALGNAISTLAKNLGLAVTTHSFRRVSATELVAAGMPRWERTETSTDMGRLI